VEFITHRRLVPISANVYSFRTYVPFVAEHSLVRAKHKHLLGASKRRGDKRGKSLRHLWHSCISTYSYVDLDMSTLPRELRSRHLAASNTRKITQRVHQQVMEISEAREPPPRFRCLCGQQPYVAPPVPPGFPAPSAVSPPRSTRSSPLSARSTRCAPGTRLPAS